LKDLKTAVDDLIKNIINNSGPAIGSIKKLYQFGSENTLKEGIEYESKFKMNIKDKMEDLKNFKNKI